MHWDQNLLVFDKYFVLQDIHGKGERDKITNVSLFFPTYLEIFLC